MNKVILIGNITKDVELTKTTTNISVARITLAVPRKFKNANGETETDFIGIVAWRTLADNCAKFLKKGSKIAVFGNLQSRSYDATDGTKRYVTEVMAEEIEFLITKKDEKIGAEEIKDEDLPF